MGYVDWPMSRRNRKATDGGNSHSRGSGGGWMHPKRSKGKGDKPGPDDAGPDALADPAALARQTPPPPVSRPSVHFEGQPTGDGNEDV